MFSRRLCFVLIPLTLLVVLLSCNQAPKSVVSNKIAAKKDLSQSKPGNTWKAPDTNAIPNTAAGVEIRYGRELLAHTARYFGPGGSIAQISNGMNCQNCHLDGGTKLFSNNYSIFIAGYPKWSDRSATLQPANQRIADCFMRSLAGKMPDTTGREVRAILTYMKWIGQKVKKGEKLYGTSVEKLPFMNAAADTAKGRIVYIAKCKVCHGADGKGLPASDKREYTYPPLWGPHSYNDGAGMYRLRNLAGFVKNNMPFGASYKSPQLTDGEAWNVAAFINTQPRPHFDQHKDWKNIKTKPIDYPFGPYADTFSEKQHKFGPFEPILKVSGQ